MIPVLTPAGQAGTLFAPTPPTSFPSVYQPTPAQQPFNQELALSYIRPNLPMWVIPVVGALAVVALANTFLYKAIVMILVGMIVFWIAR